MASTKNIPDRHLGFFGEGDLKGVYELGTDMFVVRDGKIGALSFAGKLTRKN